MTADQTGNDKLPDTDVTSAKEVREPFKDTKTDKNEALTFVIYLFKRED